MKNKIGPMLIWSVILGIFLLQALFFLGTIDATLYKRFSNLIDLVNYMLIILVHLALAALILIESGHLENFYIDKFTVSAIVIHSFLRTKLGLATDRFFLPLIGLIGILMLLMLIIKKPNLIKTNRSWSLLGILSGLLIVVLITMLQMLVREPWLSIAFKQSLGMTAANYVVSELSFVPQEEILFRGFLLGYLRRNGWEDKKALWLQGVIFWGTHFSRIIITPFSFFITLPILIFIISLLAYKSKQLFPSILCHSVLNAIGRALNLATF